MCICGRDIRDLSPSLENSWRIDFSHGKRVSGASPQAENGRHGSIVLNERGLGSRGSRVDILSLWVNSVLAPLCLCTLDTYLSVLVSQSIAYWILERVRTKHFHSLVEKISAPCQDKTSVIFSSLHAHADQSFVGLFEPTEVSKMKCSKPCDFWRFYFC